MPCGEPDPIRCKLLTSAAKNVPLTGTPVCGLHLAVFMKLQLAASLGLSEVCASLWRDRTAVPRLQDETAAAAPAQAFPAQTRRSPRGRRLQRDRCAASHTLLPAGDGAAGGGQSAAGHGRLDGGDGARVIAARGSRSAPSDAASGSTSGRWDPRCVAGGAAATFSAAADN